MRSLTKTLLTTATLAALSALFVQADPSEKKMMKKDFSDQTIVEIASGMGNFSTLVTAVKAAGLAEALSGEGPFTVFAPTNEAFAKLPEGTVEDLLKPENKEKLQKILMFHVVPGKVMAADVKTMEAKTLAEGSKAKVMVADGAVAYAGAKVIETDIMASNGVIHWIDTVAMPEM